MIRSLAIAVVALVALSCAAEAQQRQVPAGANTGRGVESAPPKVRAPKVAKQARLASLSEKIDRVSVDDLAYAIAIAPPDDVNLIRCLNGIQALAHQRMAALNNAGLPPRPTISTIYEYVKVRGLQKALQPGATIRTACAPLAEESGTSVVLLITAIVDGTAAQMMPLI